MFRRTTSPTPSTNATSPGDRLSEVEFIDIPEPATERLKLLLGERTIETSSSETLKQIHSAVTIMWEPSPSTLTSHLRRLKQSQGSSSLPITVVIHSTENLISLGEGLCAAAVDDLLSGVRLVPHELFNRDSFAGWAESERLFSTAFGTNALKMPVAPEIHDSPIKEYFLFSPALHQLVRTIDALAENNVERLFLVGAPGSGKTSLAYRYFLKRARGNFVTVNLSAENTGDKAAVKSLLCGHVTGAIPGAPAREGAFSFAKDGVCFLDETHSAPGAVMQVLMEVLESGQYLPFGATAKRQLEAALIFATNRSWNAMRSAVHLDEHARLGATMITVPDLRFRLEDIFGIVSTALYRNSLKSRTWRAPLGLSPEAWQVLATCPWRGNTRTLLRVIESACVEFGRRSLEANGRDSTDILDEEIIRSMLKLWEPDEHPDDGLYVSSEKPYGGHD